MLVKALLITDDNVEVLFECKGMFLLRRLGSTGLALRYKEF